MKILTAFGIIASTLTVVAMSTVGVHAYNKDFESNPDVNYTRQQLCLALNIYHEARGESELGQRAVAYVTINRTLDLDYPEDICDVVHQGVVKNGSPIKHKCAFSWYCDGKPDEPTDQEAFNKAMYVASIVMNTYYDSFDPTMGAVMYHTDHVKPYWRTSYERTTQIEDHIFYRKED